MPLTPEGPRKTKPEGYSPVGSPPGRARHRWAEPSERRSAGQPQVRPGIRERRCSHRHRGSPRPRRPLTTNHLDGSRQRKRVLPTALTARTTALPVQSPRIGVSLLLTNTSRSGPVETSELHGDRHGGKLLQRVKIVPRLPQEVLKPGRTRVQAVGCSRARQSLMLGLTGIQGCKLGSAPCRVGPGRPAPCSRTRPGHPPGARTAA